MPGSRRTFTYTLTSAPEDTEKVLKKAQVVMGWVCDGKKEVECHGVSGESLGVIQLSMTILGRDQWWSRQLAQDILNDVTWGLANGSTRLDLESRRQAAHQNRGYGFGRTKRYREPKARSGGASPQ